MMNCPNCRKPFALESNEKFQCETCGWFEYVDDEWHTCEAPEPTPPSEPSPAALEPSPAALEPDPVEHEPTPVPQVKEYLGGLLTITEVDNE